MTSGVALVTTVWLGSCARGSRHVDVLNAFLLYHIAIGVDRVSVFFDGDATQQPMRDVLHADVQTLVAQGRIELFYRWAPHDTTTIQGACSADGSIVLPYTDCVNYARLRDALASDVASRQMLNAELAMQLYATRNHASSRDDDTAHKTRWLLHLDVDELFYCEGLASTTQQEAPRVMRDFVTALEAAQPTLHQLTVVNYEAVPMTQNGGNYFVSATRFRRHTARIPLSSGSQRAIREWQVKSPHEQFFLFHDNGKSLVRVPLDDDDDDAAVVPASVHHWKLADQGSGDVARRWRSASNFYDPRRTDVVVWHAPQPQLRASVLHFPVCGFEWLAEKYERLGAFPDVWGGSLGTNEMKIPPCFHRQARDAGRAGGNYQLQRLYETQVMVRRSGVEHETFWKRQSLAGVCEEITFAKELLLSKGFVDTNTDESIEPRGEGSPLPRDETDTATATATADAEPTAFTVQKAWMLAAISEQYL